METRRWARANGLDAAAHRRFMERVAIVGAVLERTDGVRAEQIDSDRLALLRIDGRYPYYRRTDLRSRQRAERAVLQRLDASGGDEGRLYRLTARLWRFVDDAAREIGLAPAEDLQEVADDFRRARGLMNGAQTRGWLNANDLDRHGFAALGLDDARLSLVLDGSATSALRLQESFEPASWLVDAIRVTGLYPELARRATVGPGPQQPAILDSADLLRRHCARVDEPVPTDVERYARALDFPGGEPELVAALGSNGGVPDTRRLAPTGPRREPADWPELGAWRFLVRSCCRDTDGRPLAERNLDGAGRNHHGVFSDRDAAPPPPAELRSCPYAGSRLDHARPMNASALRALAEHWPDVIRAAAYLRRLHLERYPRTGDSLLDAYWIAATLASVPSYLLRRAADPVSERAVPSPVANLYKASLGASGMAYSMCVSRWSGARGSWAATAKAIHEYAERSGALIGAAEVCAGPPELIRRFLDIVTSGNDAEAASAGWIRDLLPAPDRCLEYGTALLRMSLIRQLGAVRHLILLDLLGSRLARSSPALAARLAAWRWRTEPWASLDRSADHEVTRWIAGQDSRTREKIVTGIKDFVGRLDAGGASRVPPALFRIVLPRRQRGVLAAIHAHQVDLTRLQQRALDGIAAEQAAALGRADEVASGVRRPGVAAEEFLRQEIS
jgi:hypothetical protein